MSQGPRVFTRSKATCAAPLSEVLTPCRGLRPHHVQRDRIGSWEGSCLTGTAFAAVGPHREGEEPHSPWSPPLAPPTPRRIVPLCSPVSHAISDLSRLNPTPRQSLFTLRRHCRQGPRNTRYQPDLHRLDRTSLRLAHLLNHLVGAGDQRWGDGETER